MSKKKKNDRPSGKVRLSQIVKILYKHKIQKGVDPVKVRETLEDLGPTYVKIGQIMSTRADIFSKRYTDELVKLREDVAPLPFEQIEAILKETYPDYEELFLEVDPVPLGSASIAQVHKAILKDGTPVVLKVKRPGIYEQMEQDVHLMRKAARLLDIADLGNGVVDFDMVLNEFWNTTKEEMDFTIEARHAMKFRKQFEDCVFINAPIIYKEYSTADVLMMEYIEGYEITDSRGLDAAGYDREEIADKIAYNYITQIIENGYFHADPHSGNIRIRDDQIVWIDFGMMSSLTSRDRELMKLGIRSIASQNAPLLVDTILNLGEVKRAVDYSALMLDMEKFMQSYLSTDLQNIDIVSMVQEIFEICHQYAIQLPKGISMLARSLMTIEGTLVALHPGLNIMQLVAKHISSWTETDFRREVTKLAGRITDSASHMIDIPVQTSDILRMMERGQLKFNLSMVGLDSTSANANRMVNRIVICVLDAALLMGSSILCTTKMEPKFLGIPLIGFFGFFFAMCLSIWLFFKMLFLHNRNKTF